MFHFLEQNNSSQSMRASTTSANEQRAQELYKKLASVHEITELKKIMKSTSEQKARLVTDIKQLRNRVQTIREKAEEQTQQEQSPDQTQQQAELKQLKKELDKNYKKMKQLKSKVVEKAGGKIEDVENSKQKNINEAVNVDKAIEQLKADLIDLQKVNKKLHKTFSDHHKEQSVNQPRVKELQAENKDLRESIAQLRKADYQKQYDSIKVQTSLVGARTRIREHEARRSLFNLKSTNTDKKDLLGIQKLDSLKREVGELKRQTDRAKQEQQARYEEMKKSKALLLSKNKDDIKVMKDLEMKKVKSEQENNLWRKRWQQICKNIEAMKNRTTKIDEAVEYKEYEDLQPLRRDYAGVLSKVRFEDRIVLGDNKKVKIVGMKIYENERGIVCLQAFYDNGQKSYVPIPTYALERCRIGKVETASNDFFKLFKVKYNQLENKVTKVEIRSNKNIKYQYGDKRPWGDIIEGDTIYGFDIGVKEYPVCVFGSYSYHKGNWFLEGFGVEINELDEWDRN